MASSMAVFSRRLTRSLIYAPNLKPPRFSINFSTDVPSDEIPDLEDSTFDPNHNSPSSSSSSSSSTSTNNSYQQRNIFQRPLENGLDPGVYKAILVGQVGQIPFQKRLKSGRPVTMFSLGTGGIRNNRRPLDNEEPREYAERCSIQWHRVCVYPERLGTLAVNHVKPGSILYVEGNLETKIFSDPITGLVRRIREVAIRRDGRLVFLGKDSGGTADPKMDLKGVGYY